MSEILKHVGSLPYIHNSNCVLLARWCIPSKSELYLQNSTIWCLKFKTCWFTTIHRKFQLCVGRNMMYSNSELIFAKFNAHNDISRTSILFPFCIYNATIPCLYSNIHIIENKPYISLSIWNSLTAGPIKGTVNLLGFFILILSELFCWLSNLHSKQRWVRHSSNPKWFLEVSGKKYP